MAGNTQRKLTIGVAPLSYLGVNAESPPNTVLLQTQDPTTGDYQNFIIGDIWIHSDQTVSPNVFRVWMLVGLARQQATWIELSSGAPGTVGSLRTNLPAPNTDVMPDITGEINLIGDGTTINITGNPGTNTVTVSAITGGNPIVSSIRTIMPLNPTDVFAASNGEISIVGDGSTIAVRGNLSPNTVTISAIGTGVVSSFLTDTGAIANPIAGQIEIHAKVNCGSSTSTSAFANQIFLNVTDLSNNTLVGLGAGNGTLSGTANTGFGLGVLAGLTSGTNNTAVGYNNQILVNSGANNTSLGYNVLSTLLTGVSNIAIGSDAGSAYVNNESSNILIGNVGVVADMNICRLGTTGNLAGQVTNTYFAGILNSLTTYSNTVGATNKPMIIDNAGFIGADTGGSVVTTSLTGDTGSATPTAGEINVLTTGPGGGTAAFIGAGSTLTLKASVNGSTTWGSASGAPTGIDNSGFGSLVMTNITTGTNNTAMGFAALTSVTTQSANTVVGHSSLTLNAGANNVAIGSQTAINMTAGNSNIIIGVTAGAAYTTTESNNILLGSGGVTGESATMRYGTVGTQTRCFIAGIAGVTTSVADAVPVLISASTSQLGTMSSSLRFKENIQDMNDQSDIVYDLKPKTFNFKSHPGVPAWGLIAEDVDEVFPQLVVYDKEGLPDAVKYHDLVPLLLNELQKLNKRIEILEAARAPRLRKAASK